MCVFRVLAGLAINPITLCRFVEDDTHKPLPTHHVAGTLLCALQQVCDTEHPPLATTEVRAAVRVSLTRRSAGSALSHRPGELS